MSAAPSTHEYPEIDLSRGLSLSGSLTQDDLLRAQELCQKFTEPRLRKPARIVLYIAAAIVGGLLVYLNHNPPARPGEAPMVEEQQDIGFESIAIWITGVLTAVPLTLLLISRAQRQVRNMPRQEAWRLPTQWLFQPEAVYCLTEARLDQSQWEKKSYVAPDLVVLENKRGDLNILPRRYAADEATWDAFCELVKQQVPPTPPPPGLRVQKPDVAPHQPLSFVDAWQNVLRKNQPIAVSSGSVASADVAGVYHFWRAWISGYLTFLVPGTLGLVGYLVVDEPRLRAFGGGMALGCYGFLGVLLWTLGQRKLRLSKLINDHAAQVIAVHEGYLEQRGERTRAFTRWDRVSRGRGTPDLHAVLIGESNRVVFLPRRVFRTDEWDRLSVRMATLPEDASGLECLVQ